MLRALLVFALLFGLGSSRLAAQQPYPRLARVVGAVHAAALVAAPAAPVRHADPLELDLPLPPLTNPLAASRRRVFRWGLSERLQLRATGGWTTPGMAVTVGFGVRF